ncbi:MAG: hypothetical protein ACOY5R_18540 [Pseudomonadota bacterium]|uniref:hypothetical protein n=1 Tax=Rhizorhabdus phycosphaerae TaxID=2711156 RepID=UPI0013ED96A6|nr:hypothetical protein [Rhizorhabdus phycosphaerae]
MNRIDVIAFFNLRRAEEERLKAARAPSSRAREAHLEMARMFETRAQQAREEDEAADVRPG